MEFEDWYDKVGGHSYYRPRRGDYQQASIDGLLEDRKMDRSRINDLEGRLIESRIRIDDLERWVAGIADDHKQIPDWIQQSARSLLAQEGE